MSTQKTKGLVSGVIALVAIATVFGLGFMGKDKPKSTNQPAANSQVQQTPKTEISYEGVENQNALELLKQSHKVETKAYEGLGELVTSIDGVAADSKHFWSLYVNNQQSQVGAEAYISKATDTITWKLEEIK